MLKYFFISFQFAFLWSHLRVSAISRLLRYWEIIRNSVGGLLSSKNFLFKKFRDSAFCYIIVMMRRIAWVNLVVIIWETVSSLCFSDFRNMKHILWCFYINVSNFDFQIWKHKHYSCIESSNKQGKVILRKFA